MQPTHLSQSDNDMGLPIKVHVNALFDTSDPKTAAMLERVNAWINFKALGAQWYKDESYVTSIDITLYPESHYLTLPELKDTNWSAVFNAGFSGLQKNTSNSLEHICIAAIANADIKEMMENGKLVEQNLQQLTLTICNYLTLNQPLPKIENL